MKKMTLFLYFFRFNFGSRSICEFLHSSEVSKKFLIQQKIYLNKLYLKSNSKGLFKRLQKIYKSIMLKKQLNEKMPVPICLTNYIMLN